MPQDQMPQDQTPQATSPQARPNIVVFLTDDHGYGDLSCMGATDFHTPHLDRLAADGARFTDWYSNSPVCSPARAALLTGRYPMRAGVKAILKGHRTATGLPPDVPTIADALKAQGYRTNMVGKWHLGLADGCRPNDHGFDYFFGHLAGCVDFFSHIFYWGMNTGEPGNDPTHDLWENNQEVFQNGEYMTDLITRRAVECIRTHGEAQNGDGSSDQPLFMYVPYNAPHYPMHAPAEYMDRFKHLPPARRIMAAMISAIDDGVGAVRAELVRQGMSENTIIAFTSDNGPSRETRNWLDGTTEPYYGGTAGPFKGHKFSLYEGGTRVPGILTWPRRIPAGQVLDSPVASFDLFPTLLRAAGGDPSQYDIDAIDIMPHVADGEPLPERDLCWEMGDQRAIRRGHWKLVLDGRLVEGAPPEDSVHLADLSNDIGETRNLKYEKPELTEELRQTVETWHAEVQQQFQRWADEPAGTTSRPSR